jgi:hypothetical protein
MNRIVFLLALAAVGILQAVASSAAAQGYPSSRPALSPWMNLFQRTGGPVDNYHNYVRPQIQLHDTLRQQNARIQQQAAGLQSVNQQLQDVEQQRVLPRTGTGSVFMDYSHYYTAPPPVRVGPALPRR